MTNSPFVIEEYVRWSDVDKAGIIFYGAYVRFFEMAETELFRAAGAPYGQVFDQFDIWLPRVHLDVDFKYPPRLDDRLSVAAYFTRFGTSSLGLNFDVIHQGAGELAAMGREVLVCTDRTSLKPRPLPAALQEQFRPFLLDPAQARQRLGIERAGAPPPAVPGRTGAGPVTPASS